MKTWTTKNNITIKTLIWRRSNVYLVTKGEINILVDTARSYRYKILKKELDKQLQEKKPDFLFLTHSHYDHCENAGKIKNDYECKIIIDERESKFLATGKTRKTHRPVSV